MFFHVFKSGAPASRVVAGSSPPLNHQSKRGEPSMKLRYLAGLSFALLMLATTAAAQVDSRDATREKLRAVLAATGPKVNIEFHQSDKNPYNFIGVLNTGLTNVDSFGV